MGRKIRNRRARIALVLHGFSANISVELATRRDQQKWSKNESQ